jgi:non-canonical poly(A) RNA polymerase PAPD5/7
MDERFQSIHIDITFQSKSHMGLKCSEMIKSFMEVEQLLRPLVLVLKMLVDIYEISDPYKGGLSSYAITLMVIALLQVIILLTKVY